MLARLLEPCTDPDVRRHLGLLTVGRLVSATLVRFAPPFLPTIARGLGVPLASMGLALGVAEIGGLSAVLLGRRIDRSSRRAAMLAGSALLVASAALAAASPSLLTFGAALVLISMGKATYDTAMGAWTADRVDYVARGRVLGLVETSWAGALLIAIPVLSVVVEVAGWRAAYAVLALVSAAVLLRVAGRLPVDVPPDVEQAPALLGLRSALPVYAAFALLMAGSSFVFVVFGAWLEDDLGFAAGAVGAVAFLLGAGELAASTGSARFADGLGKRRSILLGAALMVPAGLALGAVGGRTVIGVGILVVFLFGFEFALVSAIPLVSELHPGARAASLGTAISAGVVGRGVGAVASTALYADHGIGVSGACAAGCALAACAVLRGLVREPVVTVPA